MKITFGNIRLNLFDINEVTNALTLDIMSETSLSQVPCCVEHFTYWPAYRRRSYVLTVFFFLKRNHLCAKQYLFLTL